MYCFVKMGRARKRKTSKVYFLLSLSTPSSTGTWMPPIKSWNLIVIQNKHTSSGTGVRKVRTICVHMYADSIYQCVCVCECVCVCCAFAFRTKQEYTSSHGHKSRHVDRVGSFRRCSMVIICRAGHGRGDSGDDGVVRRWASQRQSCAGKREKKNETSDRIAGHSAKHKRGGHFNL